MNSNGVSMLPKAVVKRKKVIARLEKQLVSMVKTTKEGVLPLSEHDVKRTNKELEILKTRIY